MCPQDNALHRPQSRYPDPSTREERRVKPDLRAVAIGFALSFAGIPFGGFAAWAALTVAGSDNAGGAFIFGLFAGPLLGGAGAGANGSPGIVNGALTGIVFSLVMIALAVAGGASGLAALTAGLLTSGALLGAAGGALGAWFRSRRPRPA